MIGSKGDAVFIGIKRVFEFATKPELERVSAFAFLTLLFTNL